MLVILTETGLGSTARCRGRRRHRQANSVRVCSPTSRRVASLRPRSAGLTALTPAPPPLVQTGSCRRCSLIHPLHVVVDVPSRMTLLRATADTAGRALRRRPGDAVSLLAIDDSAPVAGRRARHPHAAGGRQAAALQPPRGRGVVRPGRCPEALAACSQAAAMLFLVGRLGSVPGRALRISLPGLRVRCRCSRGVGPARPVQTARVSGTAGPRRAAPVLVVSSRVPVMFFVLFPVESSFPSHRFADFGVAWCEPVRARPASGRRPVSAVDVHCCPG